MDGHLSSNCFCASWYLPTLLDSNKMIQEAEIVPHTSEDDAKKYLQELLNELNKQRTSNK